MALRVYRVKAVANDLEVRLAGSDERTDTDVAQAVVNAFKWNTLVPAEKISVTVARGWVTLKGNLQWQYEKEAAARALRELAGVRGVINEIVVKPQVKAVDVKGQIEAAFKRSAEIDAGRVSVTAKDGTVVLTGNVRSWFERQEAERAAWAAPGVTHVDDRLTITA